MPALPKSVGDALQNITTHITKKQFDAIEKLSQERKVTKAVIFRVAIDQYLAGLSYPTRIKKAKKVLDLKKKRTRK